MQEKYAFVPESKMFSAISMGNGPRDTWNPFLKFECKIKVYTGCGVCPGTVGITLDRLKPHPSTLGSHLGIFKWRFSESLEIIELYNFEL